MLVPPLCTLNIRWWQWETETFPHRPQFISQIFHSNSAHRVLLWFKMHLFSNERGRFVRLLDVSHERKLHKLFLGFQEENSCSALPSLWCKRGAGVIHEFVGCWTWRLWSPSCRHDSSDSGVLPLPPGRCLPHYHASPARTESDPLSDAVEHVVSIVTPLTHDTSPLTGSKISGSFCFRRFDSNCSDSQVRVSQCGKYLCVLYSQDFRLCFFLSVRLRTYFIVDFRSFRPFWLMILLAVLIQHITSRFCFIKKTASTRDLNNRWFTVFVAAYRLLCSRII